MDYYYYFIIVESKDEWKERRGRKIRMLDKFPLTTTGTNAPPKDLFACEPLFLSFFLTLPSTIPFPTGASAGGAYQPPTNGGRCVLFLEARVMDSYIVNEGNPETTVCVSTGVQKGM